ncbi:type 2 DNA topoisomerase 6 subunit B-like isoform X4 [Arvicola amphibius]|uniref:type 2 DNA topoisomerase 6 subunit B-like isoform X4 n=1 Tax=Arvicola amphibius TaxID=1047088 RepID=UPI0018E3621B|nr:type 2 DNA topoisomerase 6 subunit B-like isoform X4 [Arvicola amphibius]
MALAVCEILRYLIIHWKCEAGLPKGASLEGQLTVSIDGLSSKHAPSSLHCTVTIASTGRVYGGLVFKKFLQEIQPVLPRFSAKLTWASEEGDRSQDTSGVTPFQMTFQVNENPRSLMTDCLIIKRFLRKIIIVHHKLKFNLTVNGILSAEIFGAEKEPILRLSNGITLVVGFQHYVSKPKLNSTESHCSRIHPVLGHPAPLSIPDGMANMGLLGKLALTPAAALCPSPKVFSRQRDRISSVSIFLYGPLGLPLISDQEQPSITVFRDPSYFIDWKKHNLFMVPTLDLNLDTDLVIPDVNYQVESSEGNQSQDMDSEGPALLLFLFVDFHSRFPVQQAEVWELCALGNRLCRISLCSCAFKRKSVGWPPAHLVMDSTLCSQLISVPPSQRAEAPCKSPSSRLWTRSWSDITRLPRQLTHRNLGPNCTDYFMIPSRADFCTTAHATQNSTRLQRKSIPPRAPKTGMGLSASSPMRRAAGKRKTRSSREAPAWAGKNRKLCAPPGIRALQSAPHATTSPLWPPPMPEGRRPERPRRQTQRALRAAWRYRGERRAGASLGCCRWVLTTVASAPAGLVAARGLQFVRVAESGTQVLSARY